MKNLKNKEGVEFQVKKIDTERRVAILKRVSQINQECKRFGNFAFMNGKEIINYITLNDAQTMFNHHQTKRLTY